jgi:hypothetical protein
MQKLIDHFRCEAVALRSPERLLPFLLEIGHCRKAAEQLFSDLEIAPLVKYYQAVDYFSHSNSPLS